MTTLSEDIKVQATAVRAIAKAVIDDRDKIKGRLHMTVWHATSGDEAREKIGDFIDRMSSASARLRSLATALEDHANLVEAHQLYPAGGIPHQTRNFPRDWDYDSLVKNR